jgi:hypothetical protein
MLHQGLLPHIPQICTAASNTTPSQPPACGVSFPRGRPSPVHPQSSPPAVQ